MDDIFYMFYLVFFTDALRTIQSRDVATGATDEEGDWTCIVEKFMSLESEGILVTEELLTSPEVEPNVLESLFELCFTGSTLSPTARQERPQQHVVPVLLQVEADTYFCAAQLISQLQDNYRPGQPGVRAAGAKIEYLLSREAPDLLKRCEENGLGVVDGCFQWLHCLLLRELPLPLSLLLWDTYKAASVEDVYNIHQCMCAALIIELRPHIVSCRPELLVMLLKSPYASYFRKGFRP
ncbi:hypothetical protein AGDE_16517 [Angomonas deanei]|uniref:Rab-GTPase-TBC domain containing protein, putative n=1 Tax=Angomonas deanei TaxID=59799 RepID=A0A7G2CSU7_9TRYP|nr:hypothetical protein AGDE_16517 [Angomonas deanei]CAD2221493.1 Rab-GTPase-TBC domain containing protein, putative [Angomonas deanei]|eukprot:EPY16942.1 hypothetical protein AGDE_16517 [Angomonas deanei]